MGQAQLQDGEQEQTIAIATSTASVIATGLASSSTSVRLTSNVTGSRDSGRIGSRSRQLRPRLRL